MAERIIVTGASSGIGRAIATSARARGWDVLAVARRAERLDSLAAETGAETVVADLTTAEGLDALEQAARAFAPTGIVLNAGGAKGMDSVEDGSSDDWREMFELNVVATREVIARTLPLLRDGVRGGGYATILAITSTAATVMYPGGGGYNASKAAEKALIDVLRLELYGEPIRVMEVAPGMVKTEEFSLNRFGGDAQRAEDVYKDVQDPLSADDIGLVVTNLLALPGHVSIDSTIVKPVAQTHQWRVFRGPLTPKG